MTKKLKSEEAARKFIDDIFVRLDEYHCANAQRELPKIGELLERFPNLEGSRGIYKYYLAKYSSSDS